jgi:predicted DNA-binding protein (MmcQ/YjbR family)
MAFSFLNSVKFDQSLRHLILKMNIEEIREYALSLKDVSESFPFGNDTLVFKVNNKIFLLASLSAEELQFNVKCEPEYAIELREQYSSIRPGYHMNKKHWNTIIVDGKLTSKQLKQFISDSYFLVTKKK